MVARLAQLAEHVVGTTPGGHASARAFADRAHAGLVPVVVHAHALQQPGSACGLFCRSAVRQAMRLTPFDLFVSDRPATMANIGAVQASLRAQLCAAFAPGPQWPALRSVAEVVQQHLPMPPPAMAAAARQADVCLATETARRLALAAAAIDVAVAVVVDVDVDVGDLDVDAVMDVGGDGDSGDSDDGGGGRYSVGASDDGGGGSDDDAMAMDVDIP